MNISLIEPEKTRTKSTCCGDSFWGEIPTDKVKEQMRKRTAEMPCEDVAVYCVSCTKSVFAKDARIDVVGNDSRKMKLVFDGSLDGNFGPAQVWCLADGTFFEIQWPWTTNTQPSYFPGFYLGVLQSLVNGGIDPFQTV